jgi:hypothetical protein
MFDKIIFYNCAGFGDVHVARAFVSYVVNNIPANEYYYLHEYINRLLGDIPNLRFNYNKPIPVEGHSSWQCIDNILYINTWYGACNMKYFKQTGLNIITMYNMFKEGLKQFCNYDLKEDVSNFIPDIDFSKFNIKNIDSFMAKIGDVKKILIVNGKVNSGQAPEFSFNSVVESLASEKKECVFFMSNYPKEINKENVYYCKDIIQANEDVDIVESAYFGNFCSVIVGRGSGVYTYCVNKNNIIISPKKMLCFIHGNSAADQGIFNYFPHLRDNCSVINNFSESFIRNTIRQYL